MKLHVLNVAVLLALFLAAGSQAATITIPCSADTSLHETYPENNFGAFPFLHGGHTAKSSPTRALMKFELSTLPPGAEITAATLDLSVLFTAPRNPVAELDFNLHRMLADWGEGNKDDGAVNSGSPATQGEASWNYARRPAAWSSPGGAPGIDFQSTPSASTLIGAPGDYTFPSTPELLADLRHWIDNPSDNFGWILIAGETIAQSAKRFGSREGDAPALLTIEYTEPSADLAITSITLAGDGVRIEWTGGTPPYQVERTGALPAPDWTAAGSPVNETSALFPRTSPQSYFRVRSGAAAD